MKFRVPEWLAASGLVLLFSSVVVLVVVLSEEPAGQVYKNDGARAYRVGVPAQANPYIGQNRTMAKLWLDGWMDAKEHNE